MNQRSRIRSFCLALGCVVLGSCGSGTLSIFGGGGGGGGGSVDAPTVVGDVLVGTARTSPVTFTFRLTDAESSAADVDVLYTPPGGGAQVPLLLTGNTNLDALATSPAGVVHTREWDFAAQLATAGAYAPGYLITVRMRSGSSSADSPVFSVGNDAPVVSNVVAPGGETSGIVPISLTLADSSSDLVSILVEYQDVDNPTGWLPASSAGGPLVNIATSPAGVPVFFFWDAPGDMPQTDFRAVLRFTPYDGTASGTPVQSSTLTLDNNAAPAVLVNGSAFYATPDQRRGLPLPLRVVDPEGDTVRVVLQWRTPFGTFPSLPNDLATLAPILASPRQRRTHQIASEAPIAFCGPVVSAGASVARLREVVASQAGILSGGLAGRTLQVLRNGRVPVPAAAGWGSNPLSSPVGLLSYRDGHSAIVLDLPSAGNWRLREIDLATGAIVRNVASGAGSPDAIAYEDVDSTVLVATDVAGVWTVRLVTIADGSTTTLITTNGTTALGTVYGLVSLGTSKALMTVGNSLNALVAVDATILATPRETLLGTGLPTARGLALDPHNHNRLFIALRDWVNPATSNPDGLVISIDLLSHVSKAVTAASFPFLHPDSIAIDERSGRLIVLTDANTADGTRELRAVDLNGGGGGTAFQIASGIPNGCQGLATGPDGLLMLALTPTNDLSVAGGVEQVRTIASFDATKSEATVTAPFSPAVDPHRTWRIIDSLDPRPATPGGVDETFVWDSSDLLAGGEVVLRAVPFDTEQGLATDTGVPRPVRPGLDVLPYTIGSAASTSAPASIAMADLNGDGKLDLATANVGADRISIFIQPASGVFTAAPTTTLNGVAVVAVLTDPYSVKALDVDADGDLDIVSANHGSNNVIVWTQGTPGNFSAVVPAAGGLNAPSDVCGADLNRDGLMDLAVADTGANKVSIFFRSAIGAYPGSPSLSIPSGAATIGAPVSVAVGDFDGDGDIDIVSANQSTNNLTVFYQSGPGVFPPGQMITLGGPGITDGPSSVAVGDIDGDGRLDIACADRTGNDLVVFLQSNAGGFSATPTFTLAAPGAPLQPTHVELTDVNDDGALDLVSSNGGNDISIFVYQPDAAQFASEPIVIGQGGSLSSPSWVTTGDFDGDGHTDLAATNAAANNVAVFQQLGGASYTSPAANLVLGSALATSNPNGIAVADIDGDGDLDIVTANQGASSLSVFEQISPSIFGSEPAMTMGSSADTSGAHAVAVADLDGDGRLDVVSANSTGGSLAIFHQLPGGGFAAAADVVLGGGTLGSPSSVAIGDLDGDGDLDIVCGNQTGNNLKVWFQAPAGFAGVTPVTLGSGATTKAPTHVLAVDIDRDGDLDIVCVDNTGNDVTIFLNPGNGAFPAAPSRTLGNTATTPSPRYVAVGDLDGDGDLDIVLACGGNNALAVFLQPPTGFVSAPPSFSLTNASLLMPDTVAVADIDHDGDLDIVSGNTTSRNLTIFRQGLPGVFAATPLIVGGVGWTNSPRSLCLVDLDGDGDVDLVSAESTLDNVSIYFGSH